MIVIRLTRVGKRKEPSYRLVVQEKHRDPWGKAFEIVGNYNPRTKAKVLKEDRIKDWLAKGAKPSTTVHNMLVDAKLIPGPKMKKTGTGGKPVAKTDAPKAEAPKTEEPKTA